MGGSPLFTFASYLKYQSRAVGTHSLHSPFVFKLFTEVIKKSSNFRLPEVEKVRKSLHRNHQIVDLVDLKNNLSYRKTISSIARSSSSSPKFSAFLHLLIGELHAKVVMETGTSLGINALYLAHSLVDKVITMEASSLLSEFAKREFGRFQDIDISLEFGDIIKTFTPTIIRYKPDFIFLDADHRGSTVQQQVGQIMEHCQGIKCIVIHDIYWSKDMNKIWNLLIEDQRFPLSIDIFQAGLLFPLLDMEKQHFTLRF